MGNLCCRRSGDYIVVSKAELSQLLDEKLEIISEKLDQLETTVNVRERQPSTLTSTVDDSLVHKSTPNDSTENTHLQDSNVAAPDLHENVNATAANIDEHINCQEQRSSAEVAEERDIVHERIVPVRQEILQKKVSLEKDNIEIGRKVPSYINVEDHLMKFDFNKLDDHIKPGKDYEEIKNSVKYIVNQIVGSEAIYVGSAFENLNVGLPYEFDIQWPVKGDVTLEIMDDSITLYDRKKSMFVTPEIVQRQQKELLIEKLGIIKLPKYWELFGDDIESSIVVHKKGFLVGFVILNENKNSPKETGVLLDLIPCHRVVDEHRVTKSFVDEHKLLNTNSLNAIEKLYSETTEMQWSIDEGDLYLVFDGKSSWKISSSVVEKNIFDVIPDKVKQAYRVVKYCLQTYLVEDLERFPLESPERKSASLYGLTQSIHSYCLKNEFLEYLIFGGNTLGNSSTASNLLTQLLSVYHKEGSHRMKNKHHFLLSKQDVQIMDIHTNRQKIADRLQEIQTHLIKKQDIPITNYPLMNFPKCKLPSLKPPVLSRKPLLK